MASVIAAGTSLRHPRRAHDPGLHLLLDVRLPADRRPDVGARRPDGPRLPARRHRRADHPQRRGPAAPGRPLADARLDQPGAASPTTPPGRTRSRSSPPTGCSRMYGEGHPGDPDVFYYLTVYNEPYLQPAPPEHLSAEELREGDRPRHVPLRARPRGRRGPPVAQLLASGVALPWAVQAQQMLARGLGRRRRRLVGHLLERAAPRRPRRGRRLGRPDPHALRHARRSPAPRARWSRSATGCGRSRTRSRSGCRTPWTSLGTDGFGRSDTREALRRHFRVDAESVVVATLAALQRAGRGRRRRGGAGRQGVRAGLTGSHAAATPGDRGRDAAISSLRAAGASRQRAKKGLVTVL